MDEDDADHKMKQVTGRKLPKIHKSRGEELSCGSLHFMRLDVQYHIKKSPAVTQRQSVLGFQTNQPSHSKKVALSITVNPVTHTTTSWMPNQRAHAKCSASKSSKLLLSR